MKTMKKTIAIALGTVLSAALLTIQVPAADDVVELSLSTHDPSTAENVQILQTLCDETLEATDGRVKITIHSDSTLGPPTDGLTMLDTGVCDMLWTTSSLFADQFPMCEIFSMPMVGADDCFDLTDAMWDLWEEHPEYWDEFEGYYPLGLYSGGHGVFATSKPLNGVEDLKGLTMRVVTGPLNTMAQAMGVNIVTMGPGDLFLSMEKGVIEGYMFNLNGMGSFSLYDVTPYAYSFGESTFDSVILVLISEDAWNKVSAEDKEIMNEIWGRSGSKRMVDVLYQSSIQGKEIMGDRYIQIDEGEFYDAVKAEADKANAEYLERFDKKGIPETEAYNYVLERFEAYRD